VNETKSTFGGSTAAVRRITVLAVLTSLLLALTAGVAVALNSIECPNRAGGTCVGTDRADDMRGTPNADEMFGRAGNDRQRGFRGADDLNGGIGNDNLFGERGGDTIAGNPGADMLSGKGGNDRLNGGRDGDPDEFYCGPGTDSATIEVGDLVQTQSGDLTPVLATTVEADLEAITTCERITIKLLQ
jgi:hypothetical protein